MVKKTPKPKVIKWYGLFLMALGAVLAIWVGGTSGWGFLARWCGVVCLMFGSYFWWVK